MQTICGKLKREFEIEGKKVLGTYIYIAQAIKNGDGVSVDKAFISENKIPYSDIKLNTSCEVLYDKYGKVRELRYFETK